VDVSNLASMLCVLDCTLLPLVSLAMPAIALVASILPGRAGLGGGMGGGGMDIVHPDNGPILFLSTAFSYLDARLPGISHNIASYFVLPVGTLTSVVNYAYGHGRLRYALMSLVGLALIYLTNATHGTTGIHNVDDWLRSWGVLASTTAAHPQHHHRHVHDACGAIVGAATGMLAHACPSGGGGWGHRLANMLGCGLLIGSNRLGREYSSRCAASALAESWGGRGGVDGDDVGGGPGCLDPNCNSCDEPTASSHVAGESFFRWERTRPIDGNSEVLD
jgi:hypothetical protein